MKKLARSLSWRGQRPGSNPGSKAIPSTEPLPWANDFLASLSVGLPKEGMITFVVLQLRLSLA